MEREGLLAVIIAAIMLLTSQGLSSSSDIDNVFLVKEITVGINENGVVELGGQQVQKVTLNISAPMVTESQDVEYAAGHSVTEDENGNPIVQIILNNPTDRVAYSASSTVASREELTTTISQEAIPSDVAVFLLPTRGIQSNDPFIIQEASEITSGDTTNLEKVVSIAAWVHDNLEYDEAYGTVTKDAAWVLENKKGVCAEYTTLFTALARAAGVPARYVPAYAYGEVGWEKHAYAEAWVGSWMPVDALWLEVGKVDATHIKQGVQADNILKETISVYGIGIDMNKVVWTPSEPIITVTNVEKSEPLSDYTLEASSLELEPGSNFTVGFGMTSDHYFLLELNLEPCISEKPIIIIDDKKKRVMLEPGVEKTVEWTGAAASDIERGVTYNCPLTLNSRYLEPGVVSMAVYNPLQAVSDAEEPREGIVSALLGLLARLLALIGL